MFQSKSYLKNNLHRAGCEMTGRLCRRNRKEIRNVKRGQVNRYLDLVARRTYILAHSGVDWKPEYEKEMQQIDQELAVLRPLVDQEHQRREGTGC